MKMSPITFCPKNIVKPRLATLTVSTSISTANNDDNDNGIMVKLLCAPTLDSFYKLHQLECAWRRKMHLHVSSYWNSPNKDRYRHECQKEVQKREKGRDGFTTGAGKMKLVKMMERRALEQ